MRRILEKLAEERKREEGKFLQSLKELKKHYESHNKDIDIIKSQIQKLEEKLEREVSHPSGLKKFFFKRDKINIQFLELFKKYKNFLEIYIENLQRNSIELINLLSSIIKLIDTKDKEWDALSNNHVSLIFKSMEWRVDKLATEYQDVKLLMKKFLLLEDKLDSLLNELKKREKPRPKEIEEIIEPLRDYKYAGFENRFRGYEENLLRAQKKYLTYFINKKNVVDLGCGRGEFLQILKDNNIECYGVDSNDEMVEICIEKGLKCIKDDLLNHLNSLEDETLEGIFSAQVIEHLSPKYIVELINKAYFKLKKNCYLVLETINPSSIFSLVNAFFLDLSHQKPIHPLTLKFLLEISGFEEVEIKYLSFPAKEKLQELPGKDEFSTIINQNIDKLNKLLYAPSDYAVIGKKV